MDENALILEAQKGDLDSFNRLVLAYQNLAFTQAYRIMGDVVTAEDATQEAFIDAFRKLKTYRGGSFRAWLMRIVINACIDDVRRQRRHPVTSLEPVNQYGDEIESSRWDVDKGELPEDQALRAELRRAIQSCLNHLPLEFRTIVILVDVQGMNYIEAAQASGTPLGTVKSRLARSRVKMKECLQGFWELLPTQYRLEGEN